MTTLDERQAADPILAALGLRPVINLAGSVSRLGGTTEHYHVEGLTQVEFGLQTLYQFNSSKKIFQDVYSMWVEK